MRRLFLLLLLPMSAPAAAVTLRVPDEIPTIQAAMDSASAGDTVLVAAGVYTGSHNRNLTPRGKDLVVRSEDGPEATVINCMVGGRGFLFKDGETRDALLEGFTITYGVVGGGGVDGGAGILVAGASPTIRDCILSFGLTVEGFSGGIHCDGGAPYIAECVLEFNDVFGGFGGGLSFVNSSAQVSDCVIRGNRADRGGGLFISGGAVTIRDCEIVSNSASPYSDLVPAGGGVLASGGVIEDSILSDNKVTEGSGGGFHGDAVLTRCLITGNRVEGQAGSAFGGGAYSGEGTHLLQCTVAGNDAQDGGDGIRGSGTVVERCIVWGNGDCGDDILSDSGMTLICSCYRDLASEGEIFIVGEQVMEDPLFCDPIVCWIAPGLGGDYHLQSGSPCLPGNSPCGRIIGALPVGCPVSEAAEPGEEPGPVTMEWLSANPARGNLRCALHMSDVARASIRLFDVRGRLIETLLDEVLPPGSRIFTWDVRSPGGPPPPAGVYYLRLEAGGHAESRRIVFAD